VKPQKDKLRPWRSTVLKHYPQEKKNLNNKRYIKFNTLPQDVMGGQKEMYYKVNPKSHKHAQQVP